MNDESGFAVSFSSRFDSLKINAQQTEPLRQFQGGVLDGWPSSVVVSARLKIFYGADKPAIANFRIRKKESPE